MKPTDLKNKTSQELNELLKEYQNKLAKFSFEKEANILKNSSQIGKIKKDVARILTVMKSK